MEVWNKFYLDINKQGQIEDVTETSSKVKVMHENIKSQEYEDRKELSV